MGFRGGFRVGGFWLLARCLRLFSGSSKVYWGKRPFVGFTPGWAGEPWQRLRSCRHSQVYPRPCGNPGMRESQQILYILSIHAGGSENCPRSMFESPPTLTGDPPRCIMAQPTAPSPSSRKGSESMCDTGPELVIFAPQPVIPAEAGITALCCCRHRPSFQLPPLW